MLFKLAFKNILSRRSSAVIILFMSFAAVLLVVSNALFDSTEKGIQNSFTESFTGDFIIRPVSKAPLSLFGDETPITGELTEIETLVPYESILEFLSSNPLIPDFVPQVSGVAMLENGTARKNMSLFGVQGDIYLDMMKGANLIEGRAYTFDEKGNEHFYPMVNPRLVSYSDEQTYLDCGEGCLSVTRETKGYVHRSKRVTVETYLYLDNKLVKTTLRLKGYVAVVFQHEYDHLFGTLFVDRINKDNPFFIPENSKPIVFNEK